MSDQHVRTTRPRRTLTTTTTEVHDMAKKKTGKKATKKKADDVGFRCEVMLRALSIGATTAGLGFEAQRQDLPLELADSTLVDARLNVCLAVDPDQEELFEGALPRIESVADVHRMSVGVGTVAARLTFRRQDVDLETLAAFAGKNATLEVTRVGHAGGIDPAGADATNEDEEPGQ
jgi:hypothetical protein